MDAIVKVERRKAAAAAAAAADGEQRRPPLVPSEKNNAAAVPAGRRREAPSRFKPVAPPATPPAGRWCASPSPGRASAAGGSATCNRARSADRPRPAAPATSGAPSSRLNPSTLAAARSSSPARDAATEGEAHGHCAAPGARNAKASNGLWASARSSSPSVQPEPVPAAAGPAKKIDRLVHGLPSEQQNQLRSGAAAERKRSPLRRADNISDQCENARPSESPANRITERQRWPGMMTGRGSAGLTSTSAAPAERTSRFVSSPNASSGCSPKRAHSSEEMGKRMKRPLKEMAMIVHRRGKGNADSSSDISSQTSESSESTCHPSKAISSPVPVLHRSSSPRQGLSAAPSTSRSCQSPSRTRSSAPCLSKCVSSAAQSGAEQPVFNYIVDARKGKKNAGQIENIHQLRLLNNRYLQWRFVNVHSEDTVLPQKNGVENILYSVLESTLTLRDALTITRINVQHLQQELNLYNILAEQIGYLEQWPVLEEESSGTVVEAIKVLQASTLCLPVTSGAQVDGVSIRNVISSAVDVMQALSCSMFYLQSKVRF
ncbi:AUGMIN subunit 8-like isoform X1 [Panicum virgatum]|uniref:AUGMIN subunit 8-like isoform X1 n=1 Tax=Panicum virgatum TaxID=38727 RepID=UPI0019D6256A|nr:AUGMIN subunit 8-like isoform X1 [Panicum virgatum]